MRKKSPLFRNVLLIAGMLTLSVQGISQNPSTRVFEDWNTTAGTGVPIQNAGGNSTYGGGANDGVICKFSGDDATIWWCTYYGGNDDDQALSITTFKTSTTLFYYVSGSTASTAGVPLVDPGWGYNQGILGGSNDAFIVQIATWGNFMWSTYYGGTASEIGWSVTSDPSQNIYLCGETTSSNIPFPTNNLANAYVEGTFNGGLNDGFIVCFLKVVNDQLWTTYFGGSNNDVIYSAACHGNSYLYVIGYTVCENDFPLDDGGGTPYYDDYAFGAKGFISQFELAPVLSEVVPKNETDNSISIYPNPADNFIWISSECENCETVVVIRSIAGQTVLEQACDSPTGLNRIDIGNLAEGSYLVLIQNGDVSSNQKLIIQR